MRDNPLDPVNLAFDKSGNLIVLSSAGAESTVYTFKPGASAESLTVLQPQPAAPHPGATFILPANYWNNGEFEDQLNLEHYALHHAGGDVRGRRHHSQAARVRLARR